MCPGTINYNLIHDPKYQRYPAEATKGPIDYKVGCINRLPELRNWSLAELRMADYLRLKTALPIKSTVLYPTSNQESHNIAQQEILIGTQLWTKALRKKETTPKKTLRDANAEKNLMKPIKKQP